MEGIFLGRRALRGYHQRDRMPGQVFDFIRCSENKEALAQLVKGDDYYASMEEDAFDVVVHYTNATELVKVKDYCRKEGKIDMCTAITELIADGRNEGMRIGRNEGMRIGRDEGIRSVVSNMIRRGMEDADIAALAGCDQLLIDEMRKEAIEWKD